MYDDIMRKIDNGSVLTKEDAIALLHIENTSDDFYRLLSKANRLSRLHYENKAYIFVQIGINSAPCSGKCKFCSLSEDSFSVDLQFEKKAEQVEAEAKILSQENFDALFLMTTADYDRDKFLSIGKAVKKIISPNVQLVANIGDFDYDYAIRLKKSGFSGIYHVVRLREGTDTAIEKSERIKTLDAIKQAELDLYYCVEPIGKEHTYEEIVDEMIRARDYNVDIMAIMGRVGVKGSAYNESNSLSEIELTKIAAVTRIVSNPKKSMCIHEPKPMALLAGINQLYAEYGSNPRDNNADTIKNRGLNIESVKQMLLDAEYVVC